MPPKIYICRECGYGFPPELSHLIENKIQVYCEMCGTPFSLAGVEFKQPKIQPQESRFKPYSRDALKERSRRKFSKAIRILDHLSYLPILIFSSIFVTTNWLYVNQSNWILSVISNMLIALVGFLIVIYDIKRITPRVKEEKYDEIVLDSFCFGIIGCIIYGTGVILLIKGILIIIYSSIYHKSEKNKVYTFGLKLKNSLNHFSGLAGFVILSLVIALILNGTINASYIFYGLDLLRHSIASSNVILSWIIFSIVIFAIILVPVVLLIIDIRKRSRTREKKVFKFGDFISYFILGVFSTAIYSVGIFILLKSILIFLLFVGKPFDWEEELIVPSRKHEERMIQQKPITFEKEVSPLKKEEEFMEKKPLLHEQEELKVKHVAPKPEEKELKVEQVKDIKEEKDLQEESTKERELRLHESLLPAKDEKDKKVVKRYLNKIFNVVSKDIKDRIMDLDMPKQDKKEILKELAFLTEKEQMKHIESIAELYKEIPHMLIERIRKLPNVKTEHYDKIIAQLKYMDFEEQMEFVQFLENYSK